MSLEKEIFQLITRQEVEKVIQLLESASSMQLNALGEDNNSLLFVASALYKYAPKLCYDIIEFLLKDPRFIRVNDISPTAYCTAFSIATQSLDLQVITLYMQYQMHKQINLVYTGTESVIERFEQNIKINRAALEKNPDSYIKEKLQKQLRVKKYLGDISLRYAIERDDVQLLEILDSLHVDIKYCLSNGTKIQDLLEINTASQRVIAFIDDQRRMPIRDFQQWLIADKTFNAFEEESDAGAQQIISSPRAQRDVGYEEFPSDIVRSPSAMPFTFEEESEQSYPQRDVVPACFPERRLGFFATFSKEDKEDVHGNCTQIKFI